MFCLPVMGLIIAPIIGITPRTILRSLNDKPMLRACNVEYIPTAQNATYNMSYFTFSNFIFHIILVKEKLYLLSFALELNKYYIKLLPT